MKQTEDYICGRSSQPHRKNRYCLDPLPVPSPLTSEPATKEQPMSDTLPEQKGKMMTIGFCAECQGYTHVPWCSSYEPDKGTVEPRLHCSQPMRYEVVKDGDVFNGQQLTGTYYCERCCTMQPIYKPVVGEHQSAARGGGETTTQTTKKSPCPACNTTGKCDMCGGTGDLLVEAETVVLTQSQHQSLVAERERLMEALRGVGMRLHGIQAHASSGAENAYDIASDLRGLRDEILRVLNQQRSTSE